jgi:Glycosyltransferase family 87
VLAGVLAALVAAAFEAKTVADHGPAGIFNDFHLYWAAARVLLTGHNPYDLAVLKATLAAEGSHATIGTGYSYGLFFAILLVPLGLLPLSLAAPLFALLSLVGLALAVALLLGSLGRLPWWETLLLALAAGGFVPVRGSLYFGQANLVLLPLLALAFAGVGRASLLAVVSAVKLYPVVGFGTFLARSRADLVRMLLGLCLFGVLVAAPNLLIHAGRGPLFEMFAPDAYWTDQSINGFVSRLAGAPFTSVKPLLPGLPVTPVMLTLAAALGMLALAATLVARGRPWDGCLSLLIAYGVIAAPHNSLWNFAPILLAMAWCWPRVRLRPGLLVVLVVGWFLIEAQSWINVVEPHLYVRSPALGLLGSLALCGALLIAGLNAALLLRSQRR